MENSRIDEADSVCHISGSVAAAYKSILLLFVIPAVDANCIMGNGYWASSNCMVSIIGVRRAKWTVGLMVRK